MKIIIAGSRSINNYGAVVKAVALSGFEITEVVSGGARGVDQVGEIWAKANKIPIKQFKPDWDQHGTSAGFKRNIEMGKYADGLIAIWDGQSKGTAHMIQYITANEKPYYIHYEKS